MKTDKSVGWNMLLVCSFALIWNAVAAGSGISLKNLERMEVEGDYKLARAWSGKQVTIVGHAQTEDVVTNAILRFNCASIHRSFSFNMGPKTVFFRSLAGGDTSAFVYRTKSLDIQEIASTRKLSDLVRMLGGEHGPSCSWGKERLHSTARWSYIWKNRFGEFEAVSVWVRCSRPVGEASLEWEVDAMHVRRAVLNPE
jgi:hypothetical protein